MANDASTTHTILLVDDQPIIASAVQKITQTEPGWVLHFCNDASKAVEVAKRLKPAVLLQDLQMPGTSGLSIVGRYREHPELADMQVVILSSMDEAEVKCAAFDAGACDFIVKMPAARELIARLKHYIRVYETAQRNRRMIDRLPREDKEILELLDSNSRLVEQEHSRMEMLERVSRILGEVTDLDILLRRLLAEARAIFSCEAGSILLPEGNELVFTYAQNDVLNVETRFPDAKRSPVHLPIDRSSIAGAGAVDGMVVVRDAYDIPASSPFQFNRSFDTATGFRTRAVLAVALHDAFGRLLGVLQLINPRPEGAHHTVDFTETDQKLARHFAGMASLALERSQATRTMILRMIRAAEMRDPKETGPHVKRVAEVSARLYQHWAVRRHLPSIEIEKQVDLLRTAAMLHDLGKVGIPDAVLKKPGKLTPEERAIMEQHPAIGASMLVECSTRLDESICDVILYHQTWWDGTGYPKLDEITKSVERFGKQSKDVHEPVGDRIPLFARIVAIADVFDALMSSRVYKEAWPPERVKKTIQEEAGTHFDPEIAHILIDHFDEMVQAQQMYID